jgi:F420-dependent oxidoreductase-like protein
MLERTIGVAAMGGNATQVLSTIQDLEQRGMPAAWLTSGGGGGDNLTLFAAAAATTERILLGSCIVTTWPRHPVAAVQQVQVIAGLSNGRFRFGIGPGHRQGMTSTFGADYRTPLTNLREYVTIAKSLLDTGAVEFDGKIYHASAKLPAPVPEVPVLVSALRPRSFELCGEISDGAISWVCPGTYLRDVALPAMQQGAEKAGRTAPPLIAHTPVCVHEDGDEVLAAVRAQLSNYPRSSFYQMMFAQAGFPEAAEIETWSKEMMDSVVIWGNEEQVAARLAERFEWGMGELIAHVVAAGSDTDASRERSLELLASLTA